MGYAKVEGVPQSVLWQGGPTCGLTPCLVLLESSGQKVAGRWHHSFASAAAASVLMMQCCHSSTHSLFLPFFSLLFFLFLFHPQLVLCKVVYIYLPSLRQLVPHVCICTPWLAPCTVTVSHQPAAAADGCRVALCILMLCCSMLSIDAC